MFNRFGPYHLARLRAAAAVCDLVTAELFPKDATYPWTPVDARCNFTHVRVFSDEAPDRPRGADVLRRMILTMEQLRPNVVAVNGWSDRAPLAALSWCMRTGVPAILMSESQAADAPRTAMKEDVKRRVVRLCSTALVAGRPHLDYLCSLGADAERVFTGYAVVDNNHFAAGSEAARRDADGVRRTLRLPERFFLASSRFIEKKNITRLLHAYSAYCASAGSDAWKLVLLGDGSLKEEVLRLRSTLSLENHIVLPGFIQYDDLPLYYGLAAAFVHASTSEQWGLVVNEAMASGLPVLVSNRCGCAPDLVREGKNGFAFDPFSVDTLARHMLDLSSGKHDLAAMGQASREIIADWTPQRFAENLWKAADAALKAPRKRPSLIDRGLLWALVHR